MMYYRPIIYCVINIPVNIKQLKNNINVNVNYIVTSRLQTAVPYSQRYWKTKEGSQCYCNYSLP